jgi:peptidoglycan/LPS O-acetylase OafA/YrhL
MENLACPARSDAAPRLPGLDLLRALAISWVLIYHASIFGLVSQRWWVVRFGWMGVDLFFVLSGFLIAGQLLRPWAQGLRPSYQRFFARRLLRTVPAYLVMVAVYALFPMVRETPHLQPLWQLLTFTQNLLVLQANAFSHAWSLCVEEQFYLAFPAILALLALRPSPAKVIAAMAVILILGMALRSWLWLHHVSHDPFAAMADRDSGAYMKLIYYPTWSRLDGLLAGVAAAAVKVFRPDLWRKLTARPNLLLGAGLVGVVASTVFFQDQVAGFLAAVFGYPLLAFSLAMMVMSGGEARSIIGRYAVPGAGGLAAGSYSVYLSHKFVFHAIGADTLHLPAWTHGFGLPLAVLAAAGVGAALYWAVERPFLRLRDRLEGPSRSSLAAGPPASQAGAA